MDLSVEAFARPVFGIAELGAGAISTTASPHFLRLQRDQRTCGFKMRAGEPAGYALQR